jgi:predicted Ser/Thr protein kinase
MWYTLRLTDRFARSNIDLLQCMEKNPNPVDKKHFSLALALDDQYLVVENSAILLKKEFDNQFVSQYTYFNL